MPNDLVLNSEPVSQPTPESIAAALDAIPDDVTLSGSETPTGAIPTTPPLVLVEPWAGVNVAWVVPLAGKLLQLPYEQAAKYTQDDCWLITDDQLEILTPAMENAIRWLVWRFGAASAIGHPLVAFGAALASLTAVKYGVYQYDQHRKAQGGPSPPHRPQRQPANPQPIRMDTSTMNGRMGEPEGESYSQENREAVKVGFSKKEFVIAGE